MSDPVTDALAWALMRHVGQARIPIGTRVQVGSMRTCGTVIGPDGVDADALAVRLDRPYPRGFAEGLCCASVYECTPLTDQASEDIDALAKVRADAWDEGYTSGHSNAMRRMSDEPNAPTTPNPYREVGDAR